MSILNLEWIHCGQTPSRIVDVTPSDEPGIFLCAQKQGSVVSVDLKGEFAPIFETGGEPTALVGAWAGRACVVCDSSYRSLVVPSAPGPSPPPLVFLSAEDCALTQPMHIAVDPQADVAFVVDEPNSQRSDSVLLRIGTDGVVTRLMGDMPPVGGLAVEGGDLYIAGRRDATVSILRTRQQQLRRGMFTLARLTGTIGTFGMCARDGVLILACDVPTQVINEQQCSSMVIGLDMLTGEVKWRIAAPPSLSGVCVSDDKLVVASRRSLYYVDLQAAGV
ncbi:hypothetical protein KIPB_003869 [Kipferlia bialata]|uniref:Uncharacterized protein n=1 Tax=Kipferlia bialata TaxID=797122 RepID=A0A9K3CSV3_9EUKA|nr:hypothetical protein KIPB_003869 [Kipferlia bialata]|eukprot:g3869.t1